MSDTDPRPAETSAPTATAAPTSRDDGASTRRFRWRALEILALSAFAIAQPMYSLLGENATFLAAHGVLGWELVVYGIVLLLALPAVLLVIEQIVFAISPRAGTLVHVGLLGCLGALVFGPHLNRAIDASPLLSLVVLGALAVAFAALARKKPTQQFLHFASLAAPMFLALFLFVSPASQLLDTSVDTATLTGAAADAPVVWVVFDQFPLSFIVNEDKEIIEERFPNFARLAALSTWYPNTSSIAPQTNSSMPSALSGTHAEPGVLPVASVFPDNVFTLLSQSHDVIADEYVTQLCPDSICRSTDAALEEPDPAENLWPDSIAVLTRQLLVDDLADRFVPEINDRWDGFGDEVTEAVDVTIAGEAADGTDIKEERAAKDDDRVRFETFLDGIVADEDPTLHYLHLFHPHEPLRYLPNGQGYEPTSFAFDDDGRWLDDQEMMDQRTQQYLLQAMFSDHEVGRLLEHLESTGLLEEAALVVMSDHGASVTPGTYNKAVSEENVNDLLPVPLFIKAPGQTTGNIDTRLAQQTDILPTLFDMLGLDSGSDGIEFDGLSLLADPPDDRRPTLITATESSTLDTPPDVTESEAIGQIERLMPDLSNPYVFGPDGSLVGAPPKNVLAGSSSAAVALAVAGDLVDVDPAAPNVPANIHGTIAGPNSSTRLAVAINGTIEGVGKSYFDEEWRFTIMVDPAHFVVGDNAISIFEITDDGLLPITVS